MSGSHKPSMRQISEKTGYSVATVSNALSGKRMVSPETARQIMQAAEELGYYTADNRALKSIKFVLFRRTGEIIDRNSFHHSVIEGVEQEAREHGLDTLFIRLDRFAPTYREQLERLKEDPSGGVILLGTELLEEDFDDFCNCQCPLILLDGWSRRNLFDSVLINNLDSALTAVEHLCEKGHRDIGYVAGRFRIQAFQSREAGYRQALREHGLTFRPQWRAEVGVRTESACRDMMLWLEQAQTLPTAFFVDNDMIAFGVMRALQARGLRVPEDVSIIGFDDIPYSEVSSPALTTVRVHKQLMGREAVSRLLRMKEEPSGMKLKIACCTEFIQRESVAPPKKKE